MKQSKYFLLGVCALLVTNTSAAFEQGDIIVRGGIANVAPNETSSNIIVGGNDTGFGVTIDNDIQLGLNFAYFLTDNINIELLAATPFTHDVNFAVNDPLGTGDQLGEVTHLPPTISVNYYFESGSENFKPYVGVGLNYTFIFDEEFTEANQNAGLADLSLDDSFGLAAQVGADYMLSEDWFINASLRWIDIGTEASFNLLGTPGSVNSINIDPWVYSLTAGYRF